VPVELPEEPDQREMVLICRTVGSARGSPAAIPWWEWPMIRAHPPVPHRRAMASAWDPKIDVPGARPQAPNEDRHGALLGTGSRNSGNGR
jgi:hypothetical protein